MTEQPNTDRASVVPDAAQLRGESTDDQLNPEDVLPIGGATEVDHLVEDDD